MTSVPAIHTSSPIEVMQHLSQEPFAYLSADNSEFPELNTPLCETGTPVVSKALWAAVIN